MHEENYAVLREEMVRTQLIPRGITDERVLQAFRSVPRHLFVEPDKAHLAYRDHPLAIGGEQTISQPYIVALMTQSLGLKGGGKILEIGTGSGYQTAILAELAEHIYTVERLASLSTRAQQVLASLEYKNITYKIDDGSKGWPEHAPFDAILVAAAAVRLPPALTAQLGHSGRLIIPEGSGWQQDLLLYMNEEEGLDCHNLCGCRFVPLIEDKEG